MTPAEQYLELCTQLELVPCDKVYILFLAGYDRGTIAGRQDGYEKGFEDGQVREDYRNYEESHETG